MKKTIQCKIEENEINKLKRELLINKPYGSKMRMGTIITIALNELYNTIKEGKADYKELLEKYEKMI